MGSLLFAGDYVGISRATSLSDVILLNPAQIKNFTSHPEYRYLIEKFYKKLKKNFRIA